MRPVCTIFVLKTKIGDALAKGDFAFGSPFARYLGYSQK